MQIELKSIKIADLIDGYVNDPKVGYTPTLSA